MHTPRIGLFNVGDVNAQLDTLREGVATLTELQSGLRRDGDQVQQNTAARFAEVHRQFSEIFEGVNHVITTVQAMGDALNDIMARLKYYEENVTFLKLANKNYNAKVRDDAERLAVARKAAELRNAPPPPEATPTPATGPQLVLSDEEASAPLSEGDALMGTGELDDAVGHNHD